MFEKIKKWYEQGLWTAEMVGEALARNIISNAQYESIVTGR